jgi:3-phosphoshikimate 1-carboxyvinyltransferase
MGAHIEVHATDEAGPELVGEITVRSGGPLRAASIEDDEVAELIDELPLVAVAMASCEGESEVRDAGELRVKESDRIGAVVAGLGAIGAEVTELPDGWRVRHGTPRAARITTHGDHRIAIAFAIAAAVGLGQAVELDDPACVSVSYPGFWDHLAGVVA